MSVIVVVIVRVVGNGHLPKVLNSLKKKEQGGNFTPSESALTVGARLDGSREWF